MAIRILCPPGPHGGVITGTLDSSDLDERKIVIYREVNDDWVPHDREVVAARLWSCKLGYQKSKRSPRWMAALVSSDFDPKRSHREKTDKWHGSKTVLASPVRIARVPGLVDRRFSGATSPSTEGKIDSLFAYCWERDRLDPSSSGWAPLKDWPSSPESNTWSVTAHPGALGMQYAVLQIAADEAGNFRTPKDRILPIDAVGLCGMALTRPIEIVVDSEPDEPLMGAVTGLAAAYNHERRPFEPPPGRTEQLWVGMWSLRGKHSAMIERTACSMSGHWWIGKPSAAVRRADSFVFAVSTSGYEPTDDRPVVGGEVIVVQEFERDVVTNRPRAARVRRS